MLTTPIIFNDIDSQDQSIIYAAVGQMAYVADPQRPAPIPLARLADTMSMKPQNLTQTFKEKPASFSALRKLDSAMLTRAPGMSGAGGLVAFAVRLQRLVGRKDFGATVEPSWTRDILDLLGEDPNPVGVLMQASTVMSRLIGARNHEEAIIEDYAQRLDWIIRRLVYIGISPPTRRSIEALIMLGSLGAYDFNLVRSSVESVLATPLGFRTWRSVTSIVLAASADSPGPSKRRKDGRRQLIEWVNMTLGGATKLREHSIYPARSLDLELAIAIPYGEAWSAVGATAERLLRQRAETNTATIRERAMAAHGVWCRAVEQGRQDEAREYALDLADLFDKNAAQRNGHTGLKWAAATLRAVVEDDQRACNRWPNFDGPFRDVVESAVDELDSVHEVVRDATKFLFRHSLLQNAGVSRRQAVDTLRVGGWVDAAVVAYEKVLREAEEPWLRGRALFALGFMQRRNGFVRDILAGACGRALERIDGSAESASEMHAAIFALGDCYGAAEADLRDVSRMLEEVDPIIERSLDMTKENLALHPVSRALVYLIAVTARADADRSSDRLHMLRSHPDPGTRKFSDWVLKALFVDQLNGGVLPLHEADPGRGRQHRHS